jgi:hypothetical protein
VRIGLTHAELGASYGLRERMQLTLRLPYDIKATRVHYTLLDGTPYTPPYGDIHHRDETLTGISDPTLSLETSPATDWVAGLGVSLPAGHTVEDPIRLGALGLKHEHIQFGSGTFRPTLMMQWRQYVRVEARLSLYTNDRGYRAPHELFWSAGGKYVRLTGSWQGTGRWHGVADEGSGFYSGGVRLTLPKPWHGTIIAPSIYRELWSHGFEGQRFKQGTTFGLALTRTF